MTRGEGEKSTTHASTDVVYYQTDTVCFHRPLNISFRCARQASEVDIAMRQIYDSIVQGNAAALLEENPYQCAPGVNTGHCGNVRGHLAECKCVILNRRNYPQLREAYENSVIAQVISIIGNNKTNFQVRIAMFATGMLHGEQCLLIKLIDTLKAHYAGTIHISLIDTDYKDSINISHSVNHLPQGSTFPWNQLLGYRKDFEQFIIEMSLCLPSNIILEGSIFGSAEDYILKAQSGCRHDIMIGADLDGLDGLMDRTNTAATRNFLPAIALVKREEKLTIVPKICHFNQGKELCLPLNTCPDNLRLW